MAIVLGDRDLQINLYHKFKIKMMRISNKSIRVLSASKAAKFSSSRVVKNIGFGLNQDQLDLQDMARKFTAENIIPNAAYHDRTGEYPTEILKKAWEAGLLNGHVGEKYGGLGLGVLDCAVLSEELAYGLSLVILALIDRLYRYPNRC